MDLNSDRPVVLLAEDDVLVRNMVRLILEGAGFQVLPAADGMEALTLSRQIPGRIDVLLTDYDMPHMNGVSLMEQIKRERPGILVLIMSGRFSDPIDLTDSDVKFLPKPFSAEVLVQAIRNLG